MKGKVKSKFSFLIIIAVALTACHQQVNTPVVQAVYPSSDVVPENLLRMYVQFSHPMKTTGNLEKIKIVDKQGHEVKHVFFNNVYELWNSEQTQLTLILDPARVKTGLNANESWGRAIKPDNTYQLVIEGLQSANHQTMKIPFKKKIRVEKADLQVPDLKKWKMKLPKANSKEAFTVQFPQMLDYNSLKQRLIVTDSAKKPLKGSTSIRKFETEWQFQPALPWKVGSYRLYVNTRLEDPAGNNLNGLFDHKMGTLKYNREGVIEMIPFEINP